MKQVLVGLSALALVVVALAGAASGATTTTPTSTSTTKATSTTTRARTGAPTTTRPGNGAVRGVTATTITVGGIGAAALYGGADVGARARFQRANDAGGVNGRKIDYLGLSDDGGDPTTDTDLAKQLVESKGVFAVVPAVTPDLASGTYLAGQEVPWFGWALSSSFCGSRYGFGFSGCPVPKQATSDAWPSVVAQALPNGASGHAVAIVAEDSPSGRYEVGALSAGAESVGLRVAYAKAPLGVPATPDYDAVAKAVLTSNNGGAPDAVFVVGGTSNVLGMQQALAAAVYFGVFTNRIQYSPDFVAPAVGASVFTPTAPAESADNPAVQQLVADVQKVAPGQPVDQAVMAGYWSADMFLAAVRKAGRKLTPAALERAANTGFTYRVANTVGPTRFPGAHSLPTPCGALVTSSGTAFTVKVPYKCGHVVPIK